MGPHVQHGSTGCGAYARGVDQPIAVFSAVELDEHHAPDGHPERPGRLVASLAGIPAAGLVEAVRMVQPRLATVAELERVHDPRLIAQVRDFCEAAAAISTTTPMPRGARGPRRAGRQERCSTPWTLSRPDSAISRTQQVVRRVTMLSSINRWDSVFSTTLPLRRGI